METNARRRRVAVTVLLVNVGLIVLAAMWRHAGAQDSAPPESHPVEPSAAVAPQVELPSPEAVPSATPAEAPPATPSAIPPLAPSVATEANLSDDPLIDELRKVVRDPNSGLDIPRLDESSPLMSGGTTSPAFESSERFEQRMATVHALSTATLALIREARSLADAGRQAEATAMLQHASDLRAMIAALAKKEGSP